MIVYVDHLIAKLLSEIKNEFLIYDFTWTWLIL